MLSHADNFAHRRFYTQTLLQNTFTRRNFYTQMLLHTETFTHRRFYTQKLLHTEAFTHRSFYTEVFTQKLARAERLLHRNFYMQTLLHIDAFTHRRFDRQTLLHNTFTRSDLYTDAFTCRQFYTDALTHRRFYRNTFTRRNFLHTDAFTQRSVYTQKQDPWNRKFTSVFGDRNSFRAKGLRRTPTNRKFIPVLAIKPHFVWRVRRTLCKSQFHFSFWRSNLISCEKVATGTRKSQFYLSFCDQTSFRAKVAFRAVSLALPRAFKREIEKKEKARGQERMWRCQDEKMGRWEDVKRRRCEDEKMWRWEDVNTRNVVKMWGWEDVRMRKCETEKMFYTSPLLGRTQRSDALGNKTNTRATVEFRASLQLFCVVENFGSACPVAQLSARKSRSDKCCPDSPVTVEMTKVNPHASSHPRNGWRVWGLVSSARPKLQRELANVPETTHRVQVDGNIFGRQPAAAAAYRQKLENILLNKLDPAKYKFQRGWIDACVYHAKFWSHLGSSHWWFWCSWPTKKTVKKIENQPSKFGFKLKVGELEGMEGESGTSPWVSWQRKV